MKLNKSSGIIINKFKLRDADLFLTIFTRDEGKMVLFAKSARNIKSSRATKLDLFSYINFNYIERNHRYTLTSVDLKKSYRDSKDNLYNISRLFQIGELIDKLLPENEVNQHIFDILDTALSNLHRFHTKDYMRRFKVRILKDLGYGDLSDKTNVDDYITTILESPLKSSII